MNRKIQQKFSTKYTKLSTQLSAKTLIKTYRNDCVLPQSHQLN